LVSDFDAGRWDELFAVNARGRFFGAKCAAPHLRMSGKGSIMNMSSMAGRRCGPGMTACSATKGSAIAFSIALATEVAKDNIRVNAICSGGSTPPFQSTDHRRHGWAREIGRDRAADRPTRPPSHVGGDCTPVRLSCL